MTLRHKAGDTPFIALPPPGGQPLPHSSSKAALRRWLRQQRKLITLRQRRAAQRAVLQRWRQHPRFRRARRVGLYVASGSEFPTAALARTLRAAGQCVYAPRIARNHQLRWLPWSHAQPRHALGMHQPSGGRPRPARTLDVLVLPLLAVDGHGTRLGQGGGYYDRLLARLGRGRPWRVGLCFARQTLACTLPQEAHDQALHAVLTERGLYRLPHPR